MLKKAEINHEGEYFRKHSSSWVLACRASKVVCRTRWKFKSKIPNIYTQKQANKTAKIKYKQAFKVLPRMYLVIEEKHDKNPAQNGVCMFVQKKKAEILHMHMICI